jgi:hypothetical protein
MTAANTREMIAAADAKLAEANARYMVERTPEARAAVYAASLERSALGPATNARGGRASRAGQRQAAERRAREGKR